jgi:hypothetical protein
VLTTWCVAAMYSSSGSLSFGVTNTGGVEITFFSYESAASASSVHSNFLSDFFMSAYNGRAFSPSLAMNQLNAATRPASYCTSCSFAGLPIVNIA